MANLFPNSYLSTASQPWGREVEKQLVNLNLVVNSNEVNNNARDVQLANSLSRVNIALNNILSVEEAVYYPGTTEINGANIRANTIAANKISAGELIGFDIKTATTGQRVQMANNRIDFYDSANNYAGGIFGASGPVISFSGGIGVSGASGFNGAVTMLSDLSVTGNIATDGNLTRSIYGGGGTTGASFNNSGNLIRTTSSARYKQDISSIEFNYEDVLALQPKQFRLRDEANVSDSAIFYPGFIAEEIAGTGLDIFVSYIEVDGQLVPDGVRYAELTSALVSAIKHQDGIIKNLTTRIEELEAK